LHYISTDPYWRTNRGNGNWATDLPIGRGSFSLWATDPVDNDVRYGDNHPVVLTCTGRKGNAACKMSVRMEVGSKWGSCLEISLCSGSDCIINGANFTSDQSASTNRDFGASSGAMVNSNVEAYRAISGSTYTKSRKLISRMRYLPDPVHVFDSYVNVGTPIPYTSLPQSGQNELIANTDFETDVNSWYVYSGDSKVKITRDTSIFAGGQASLKVSNRKTTNDVAAYDVPLAAIVAGHTYTMKMSIYTNANVPVKATLALWNSGGNVFTFSTPAGIPQGSSWCNLEGTITPTWTGTLTKATIGLETSNTSTNYNMDQVSLKDMTFKSGAYYIDHKLLSPNSNPFGATNANGIYVLDCGGKDVIIADSRIVGTLVLKRASANTVIRGSINSEPAIASYPALLTDSRITVALNATPLSESNLGMNFNPIGSPYPYAGGTADAATMDTYPSQINGIVYSATDMDFSGDTTILGNITVNGKTSILGTALRLTYSNVSYNQPPPGFDVSGVLMNPVPGTWQRVPQ